MWRPARGHEFIPRSSLSAYAEAAGPAAGLWAYDALRVARGEPRFGLDTDQRSIPNELGWIGPAVHLDKGCYRGQETVARVHTLGRPPRRLVRLLLDGTEEALPAPGSAIGLDGRAVGTVGGSARHFELGPIALGLLKRGVDPAAALTVSGIPASQEALVDPEVGLHVRARL
jgi:folate-binding protein YgfZ